ncbi:MAG TPA: phosphotransferase [Candidatus Saccharimonadales bacterium]|nr:phosphotransferase [Candidatus Saccharimonadales bacterium]
MTENSGQSREPYKKQIVGLSKDNPMIGPYKIRKKIGEGGQSIVYLSTVPAIGPVAVKLSVSNQPFVDERFVGEVDRHRRAAAVSEWVVPLLGTGQANVEYYDSQGAIKNGVFSYLVTPFAEGGTLQSRINANIDNSMRRRELLEEGLLTAGQALDDIGLQARIVHRDFTPNNMIFHDGDNFVYDFGLAVNVGEQINPHGFLYGVPSYTPPEMVYPYNQLYHSTNVWQAGANALKIIDGREFTRRSGFRWMLTNTAENRYNRYLNRRLRHLPTTVQTYLHDLLAYWPEDRPGTFMEVFDDLGRAVMNPKSPEVIYQAERRTALRNSRRKYS